MKLLTKLIALPLLMGMIFSSCDLNQFEEYGWKPKLLGPILKTQIDYYDLEELIDIRTDYTINAGTLGDADASNDYPENEEIDVDPFGPLGDFPPQYRRLFTTDDGRSFVISAIIEEFRATVTFNNVFPIPIGEGTKLVIRDSTDQSVVLLDHPIEREIAPGEDYQLDLTILEEKEISGTLEFFITDFNSPGGEGVTFTGEDFIVNFAVDLIDIKLVNLVPDLSYAIESNNPFQLDIEEGEVDAYDGSIYLWVTNAFPTQFDLRMVLLDSTASGNDAIIHEFFIDEDDLENWNGYYSIESAELDMDGNVISPREAERVTLAHIKDIPGVSRANQLRVTGTFSTSGAPPTQYVLTDETYIDILITTKVEIDPSKAQ